ncbi:hypothetical protein GGF46_001186 [Coemansia sp. RSA 552]|nr:hypothetical protein GGF46_001186 [Coemansia sp. RSA 552]
MAHDDTRHFLAAPLRTKQTISNGAAAAAGGAGLPQLDISRCVPPTALGPLSSSDTLAPLEVQSGLSVRVDRTRVIGTGQYSTVCMGMLELPLPGGRAQREACAIKIPHANNLDARELGLIEAAALWQAGSAPQTVRCYGLVNLKAIDGPKGVCEVGLWPEVAAQAISGDGEWALVLEYCEGGVCWSWMTEHRLRMDAELFFVWARQLATALVALKAAGMAHMDIKGHNMLLTRDGQIRLADFTAASFSAQAIEAMQQQCPGFDPLAYPPYMDFSGTIPYSAPEALAPGAYSKQHGNDELHKMDIYALGVSLYTMFVGGREPYATVKSAVEQMLLASKGAFWEWEERHYLATLQSAAETAPSTPVDVRTAFIDVGYAHTPPPSSPIEPKHPLSRSLSLGPKPLTRRRTLKSRKAAPREFRRFLSGDLLPVNIESLLCSMVNPDPLKRPDAAEVLRVLDTIESDIFEP